MLKARKKSCQGNQIGGREGDRSRTYSSISHAPVQYLTPAFSPADSPSSLMRKSNSNPFLTRQRSCLFGRPRDISKVPYEAGKMNSRSHPQQRAEVIASVADVDNLFEIVHLFPVLLQPILQFIALAHVDQASNLTRVLIRRVGGDSSTNHETVLVLLRPVRRISDNSMEQ